MCFVVGLTGGIGSGKTAVSDYFAKLGIDVVDADVISHQLTNRDSPILDTLRLHFGDWILDEAGNFDRQAMRQHVFNQPLQLEKLNAIMHPAIRQSILDHLSKTSSSYVILSVPLLFEGRHQSPNLLSLCHHVLVVDVPVCIQKQRAANRDNNHINQIQAIIDKQISREQRLKIAEQICADVVDNTGTTEELYTKLAKLHGKYLQLSQMKNYQSK